MTFEKYTKKIVGNKDERAVSPVIGVILMVAITVILAAVIAAFVLDMGDSMGNSAPQANFEWEEGTSGEVTITHEGGDPIPIDTIGITKGDFASSGATFVNDGSGGLEPDTGSADEMTAGDTIIVESLSDGDEVSVVWESDGNSDTLDTYEVGDVTAPSFTVVSHTIGSTSSSITADADIENDGSEDGDAELVLYIDGEGDDSQVQTITTGSTATYSLEVTGLNSGQTYDYTLEMNGDEIDSGTKTTS